ncbi:phosphatase PAP2 family protein [Hymenobacter rubidus]|uniref:phosphatase PAP2 family protein n=1 Tax=Hymenobacter rubidus TaxID=1441626 RepID=UPI00191D1EF0|nr:phosphatase PAP2 family protein [Hymenobacter rubidus]
MKFLASLALAGSLLTAAPTAQAQQSTNSPYHTRFAVDGPVILGLGAVSAFGLYRVQQKHGLTDAELANLKKEDVPSIDRFSAGYYSDAAQTTSDLLCYPSLVIAPGLLALNDNIRSHYGQVLGLYVETVLASESIFTTAAGNVYRYRPYLYGTEGGGGRSGKIATNSFFSGHTANTATATFFAAKVMHDFNPGYSGEAFVWGAAAAVPVAVAYFRIEAGKHFLSDNLLGYAVGATMGVVVPQLHKVAGRAGVSLVPMQGLNVNGYAYSGMLLSKRL